MRMDTRAFAEGTSWLVDSVSFGASIPSMEMALHPHAVGDPAFADELRCGPHPDLLAELLLGQVERVCFSARDPWDGDVASIVVQGRESLREHGERVGHGSAELARVHGVIERAHLDVTRNDAAERDGESRFS